MSIASRIRDKSLPQGYEIQHKDVDTALDFSWGDVATSDVGKRCFTSAQGGFSLETDNQRDERLGLFKSTMSRRVLSTINSFYGVIGAEVLSTDRNSMIIKILYREDPWNTGSALFRPHPTIDLRAQSQTIKANVKHLIPSAKVTLRGPRPRYSIDNEYIGHSKKYATLTIKVDD